MENALPQTELKKRWRQQVNETLRKSQDQRQIYFWHSFRDGRRYDADLSAAYNIAARYWIRELHEKFPKAKTEAAKEVAEVPSQVPDGATVVGAVDQPSKTRRKAKATRGNAVVAGQGITCPVSGSDVKVFVTGVPVSRISRHSLRSLV